MCFASILARALQFPVVILCLALVAGCNTTPVTRASGVPGAPTAGSPGASDPSIRVETPGMPGLPSPGSGNTPGALAPVTVSIPAPQSGAPAAGAGDTSAPPRADARQQPAGTTSAGAGDKSDDEILAEALRALEGRPTPGQPGAGAAGATPEGTAAAGPAGTDAEKKQALGEQLEQGFAKFDRVMLSERQANNERADRQGGEFAEDDAFSTAGDSWDDAADEPLQTAALDTDSISVKSEGNISTPSHSQVPPDLADAGDDDIIARQLREAAMKEQDPELREKLWDEYRKYKRDLR